MAKEQAQAQPKEPIAGESPTQEQSTAEQPAVEQPTKEQLMAEMQNAMTQGDWKLVSQVSRKIDNLVKTAEKAELAAKTAALDAIKTAVGDAITAVIEPMIVAGQLDAADGVWYSYDFGEQAPTIRLARTAARAPRAGGGGTGKKFDISTDDMLAKHGTEMYKDTGMTIQQAYESNTDKNYRYAIRQKLLKLEGVI